MKKLFFCLLIALVPAFVIVQDGCTKASAQPKAAALATSCTDTSGVYTPVAVSTFNSGTVTFNPAHFIRICNEVYVSGSLSATNDFDTAQSSLIQISLPFPSDLTGQNGYGQALVGFNGNPQPTMGSIGFIHTIGATGVVVNWKSTKKNFYGMIYYFTYTIK